MEWTWNYLIICSLVILFPPIYFLLFLFHGSKKTNHQHPPGPPGWPIVGHIFKLGSMPHRTLATFAHQYGPVVSLKLGFINTVVILSANAAAEFFKKQELNFMERCPIETMRSHNYHEGSLFLAPPNAYWRVLKRICTYELFANRRINETAAIRSKCVDEMIMWYENEIKERKDDRKGVEVAIYVFLGLFNMIGNLVFSRDLVDPKSKTGSEFFDAMMGIMELSGTPNVSDFFSGLKWLDLQGLKKRMDRDMGKVLEISSGFVKERLIEREKGVDKKKNDFLDVLMDFQGSGKDEPDKLQEKEITIVIAEMFFAGTETTSTTIEWILSELLRNPEIMTKVKAELNNVVGPNKKFSESHIDNMPYMQAVVKETFRLHPPAPFLVPRKAAKDIEFMGYHIPKGMQVLVSIWAIGRDGESWKDPYEFKPERFLGSNVDYKGQHYELIPFGAGRRMCLGLPLANRILPLMLGSLLHEFDWELESNVTPETMDMKEKLGITARKLIPLRVIPKKPNV